MTLNELLKAHPEWGDLEVWVGNGVEYRKVGTKGVGDGEGAGMIFMVDYAEEEDFDPNDEARWPHPHKKLIFAYD